ncbi:acyl-CoA thioesterase [Aestuariirhabdus litorea]|uniref:Acyl-CoA thioesterase n=1 Tax=Aestuariirhabdus litorea TaxID=2528527 RepID=A0A3P3VJ94_9GAMM|nr:hotdog domain-containing protein [Aestuariirhabdus litorea]RRJ82760.1 acyl-CoA thioesterase [Aestuariirhabdus litorea]RWW92921.1 acyl-CoA thioesterase [Endozoicomonadaceae bacterium GTF-13]
MKYFSRRVIKPGDLNPAHRLFGGTLLAWIDEEAAIFAGCQMKSQHLVTKYISEINFLSSARNGDVVEFGMEVAEVGTSSLTVKCVVRNKATQTEIIQVDRIVFVSIDEAGRPTPHLYSAANAA